MRDPVSQHEILPIMLVLNGRNRVLFRFAVVLAVFTLVTAGAQANLLVGVDFQPYIGAWSGNPLQPPLFNSYSYADVLADLSVVKAAGYTSIKTYGVGTSPFSGSGTNLDSNQYNVPAAHALGMTVIVGA